MFEIVKYIVVVGVVSMPGFIVCMFFDFMVDLKINFFSDHSYSRVFFSLYFIFVNFAYLYVEKREFLKKFF